MYTTPLWVPLLVAALGIVSTVVGIVVTQIMANRRERATWTRELAREQARWLREDRALTFEHRRAVYVEFYESLRKMMLRVYDHGMGLSDEGTELPWAWQMDAGKRFAGWKCTHHQKSRERRSTPMTPRGGGVTLAAREGR